MAPKLNIGLRMPAVHPANPDAIRAWVQRAEALDYHSIWVGDHVFYHADVLQPLQLLSWIAALTSRVRLGTAVMLTAYLNPVLLAKALASVDVLSGGRLTMGISTGGTPAEYSSIGVPHDQRVGRLVELVRIMRKLWQEDDVSYEGRYYNVSGGNIRPKPVQQPGVPLYFGATSEAMLKRIARLADGFVGNGGSSIPDYVADIAKVRAFAAERGRDPNSLGFAKLQGVSVHADKAKAFAMAEAQWKAYYGPRFNVDSATVYGPPEECAEQLAAFTTTEAPEVTLVLEPSNLNLGQLELLRQATKDLG